jgi:hypothetical protein
MQIGSIGLPSLTATALLQSPRPEAAERGPDNDGDSDDGGKATALSAPDPASGRGTAVDLLA